MEELLQKLQVNTDVTLLLILLLGVKKMQYILHFV